MGPSALTVTGAAFRHPGTQNDAFHDIDLELRSGELFALVGSSGCGKSSLLRVLAELTPPTRGTVTRSGPHRALLVLQRTALLPWLTVRKNIALGHRYAVNADAAADVDVDSLINDFGLTHLAGRYPDELSGGQRQLVSIARAVAVRPAALLLDEPFSALDPAARHTLQDWVRELPRRRGLAVLIVTHDPDEALYLGDRIGLLRAGRPGIGPIWEPGRPNRADVAGLDARKELLSLYETGLTLERLQGVA